MKLRFTLLLVLILFIVVSVAAQKKFQDTIRKGDDKLIVHMIGHGSLYFEYKSIIVQIDPYSSAGSYSTMPKADLIFITHGHSDHFDINAINNVKKDTTRMILTQECKNTGKYTGTSVVMNNGDSMVFLGIPVKAVPAYNLTSGYHPKGTGNGYIFSFGNIRVYVAGDTEKIPEMSQFGPLDIAFLPVKLPYTMNAQTAAEAALILKPAILYPYHYDDTDLSPLITALKDNEIIEVRLDAKVKTAPSAPVVNAATNITETGFTANWAVVSASSGYRLDVSTDSLFTNIIISYSNLNVSNVKTYNVSGITANTVFYYRVRAYNSVGTSANSNVVKVTTLISLIPLKKLTGLNFYPNPANSNLFITGTEGYKNLNIYNLSGKLMIAKSITGSETEIDISILEKGIYLVELDQIAYIKVVKQ